MFVSNIPILIVHTTDMGRRPLLQEVLEVIYRAPHQAMAVRPTAPYAGILKALDQSSAFNQMFVQWAGWAYPHHTRTWVIAEAPCRA